MAKASAAEIRGAILKLLPKDGSSVGNKSLRGQVEESLEAEVSEETYFEVRDALIGSGKLVKGQGRGGSVRRVVEDAGTLHLSAPAIPEGADKRKPRQAGITVAQARRAKTEVKARRVEDSAKVVAYRHSEKRRNNPDVGVVTPDNDPDQPKTKWAYDPHIDPALQFDVGRAQIERLIDDALASGDESTMRAALEQLKRQAGPYLNWAGKAERTSFEVDTVSLHVHERMDPSTILGVIQKRMKQGKGENHGTADMFRAWFEEPLPLREAVDFYKHDRGWSNRLVSGDSLLVMNSLLQKEGMAGQVQMIYIDPPYGIKYGSNFQPFVNKRDVKDRKDEDLTQEPEMIKAFRDTWELGIHSYLTYLRDRLLVAKELLHKSGSVFVQISDENVHLTRNLLDEIFGIDNFCAQIVYQKAPYATSNLLPPIFDTVLWYAKNRGIVKYKHLFSDRSESDIESAYKYRDMQVRAEDGEARRFASVSLVSPGPSSTPVSIDFNGKEYRPAEESHWKTTASGIRRAGQAGRLFQAANSLRFKSLPSDFNVSTRHNIWTDTITGSFTDQKVYVVQTNPKIVERCMLMTTDPGDLVLDPTCGSGTTAFVAEKWGRRWITCDTSRVAVTLAKQRLMTASYDYYELKYPHEGLRGGFIYRTVPHVTLKSIANNPEIDEIWDKMHPAIEQELAKLNSALKSAGTPFKVSEGGRKGETLDFAKGAALQEWEVPFDYPADWNAGAHAAFDAFHIARRAMQKRMDDSIAAHADQETLYDRPTVSRDKLRITGPFTVEAVPFPTVLSLDETQPAQEADSAIARSGESQRQHGWRDELLKTGIRGKGGQILRFAELEPLPDMPHLHCTGYLAESGERVVVSFGPEYAALEQRQVELAMREAGDLFPRPKMIVFCAFTFDPEAAKDIDATKGLTALKAQMNTDLLTEDLKKNRSSNQSFWLMGQPDVDVHQRKDGLYVVEVNGFDYFDITKGELKSGGKKNIAAWSLDTDYDERCLFPCQVFFPMAGAKDGWNKLKRDIKAELDESKLDKLHGTVSLPFEPGDHRKIAVKIVDDRGLESLKVILLG
ncbi:site-specific DNA-methyltransferase [Arenimonas aestuarii]